jgi:hypothetical protein
MGLEWIHRKEAEVTEENIRISVTWCNTPQNTGMTLENAFITQCTDLLGVKDRQ